MQQNEHATATKHVNKIHGRDAHKMQQRSSTELRPIHPLGGSNKHGKNANGKTDLRLGEINTCVEFQII